MTGPDAETRALMAETLLDTWVDQARKAEAARDRLHGLLLQANEENARLRAELAQARAA